ncbi:MAG: hypothetical protein AB1679_00775 [Actinomycetota bacterium]
MGSISEARHDDILVLTIDNPAAANGLNRWGWSPTAGQVTSSAGSSALGPRAPRGVPPGRDAFLERRRD